MKWGVNWENKLMVRKSSLLGTGYRVLPPKRQQDRILTSREERPLKIIDSLPFNWRGPKIWSINVVNARLWGKGTWSSVQFSWVQSLSRIWLLATPWTAARRHPCPSPTPGVHPNPWPSSWWCHPTISSSVVPFSSCPQSFSASGSFPMSTYHIRWPKYWSFSFSISPTNEDLGLISFRMDWLDLLAVQGTLKSLLPHHSSKASILQHSAFFIVQISHPYMTTIKTITLTKRTFVDKVMPLLFNMLSRLVITFLPRSKHPLISWLQSPSAVILESGVKESEVKGKVLRKGWGKIGYMKM